MVPQADRGWRAAASDADRRRIRDWREAFIEARETALRSGHVDEVAREGALLEPDAALGGAPIPDGEYRCRVVKVGAKSEGLLNFVSYPAFRCRIAMQGEVQSFTKLTGSQRHVGIIFPDDAMRQVFLGTLVLGDEPAALPYGQDATRDVAGLIERIGPARWRLVLPRPHFESKLDVVELQPIMAGAN